MLLLDKTSSLESLINRLKVTQYTAAILFVMAVVATAAIPRTSWPLNAITFAVAAGIFLAILGSQNKRDVTFWIAVGLIARVALLPIFPQLSDDIYRFVWDGHMVLAGENPYGIVPQDWIETQAVSSEFLKQLVASMNSPGYFTVYPPISQLFFTFSAWIGGESVFLSSLILKFFLLIGEVCTVAILIKVLPITKRNAVLLYAMNPLVIIEVVGNVHFEGLMVLSLVLVCWLITAKTSWDFRRYAGIAGAFALGIGVKLLPIVLFPFLWRRVGTRKLITLSALLAVVLGAMFVPPFVTSDISGASSSIGLYFQTFEFNASIYYLLRWLGYIWKGYNMIQTIGMITGIATMVVFGILFLAERKPTVDTWARVALLALSAYLAASSIVHPWYVVPLVALSTMTSFRFPVLWSIVVFLSYSAYAHSDYSENLWLVALEYIPVYALAAFEILTFRKSQT